MCAFSRQMKNALFFDPISIAVFHGDRSLQSVSMDTSFIYALIHSGEHLAHVCLD